MISIESVSLRFTNNPAPTLSKINLKVAKGDWLALIGPSGCGKSTFIKMLVGYKWPNAESDGKITIDNKDNSSEHVSKSIGYLPQDPLKLVMPWFTCKKNLQLFSELHSNDISKSPFDIDDLLNKVGLSQVAERYPLSLSGGESRRLALAIVLSCCPEIIFLDEPSTGLDLDLRFKIWELLYEYKVSNIKPTVIMITHNLDEAAVLCDYAIFCKKTDTGSVINGSPKKRSEFRILPNIKPSIIYVENETFLPYLAYLKNEFNNTIL